MNEPLITSKWIALTASLGIAVMKYCWAIYAARKRDLIISIRLFTFYPGRRIQATTSFAKKHFMSVSNNWSLAFWICFTLCGTFWLLEFIFSRW
jgi:hypothetical protein